MRRKGEKKVWIAFWPDISQSFKDVKMGRIKKKVLKDKNYYYIFRHKIGFRELCFLFF